MALLLKKRKNQNSKTFTFTDGVAPQREKKQNSKTFSRRVIVLTGPTKLRRFSQENIFEKFCFSGILSMDVFPILSAIFSHFS